ncbi:MAG: hypothetical protein QW514_09485 [Thermoprotei archaeon]
MPKTFTILIRIYSLWNMALAKIPERVVYRVEEIGTLASGLSDASKILTKL